MNKEEVFQFLKEHSKQYCQEKLFIKKFPEYYQDLSTWYFPEDFTFQQKLYHYFHNDPDLKLGICKRDGCENRCHFYRFGEGYKKHCSKECSYIDSNVIEKRKQTCIDNLGVCFPSQNENVRKKMDETNCKKYGCKRYSQTEECKKRVKETSIELFGVEHYSKTDEYKQRIKETSLMKYGCKSYAQTNECKNKIKETCIERYGVEHYMKTSEGKQRVEKTNMRLYNSTCSLHSENISIKVKEIILKKYGKEYYLQTDECRIKSKNTCKEKYGKEFYSQTNEYKDKVRKTCIEKYGVENYAQTNEFAKYHRKQIEYDGLTFDSSWEVTVYQYCKENNIPCEYQPNITFEYEYDGKKHYYHPDFLIDGQLYEVKGDQFFDGDKMINPYDRTQDELYEAKHQCMIKNDVIILNNISNEVINKILKGEE